MTPMNRGCALFLILLAATVAAHGEEFDAISDPRNFGFDPKNPNKTSPLGDKRFDIPMLDQFGGTAAGFDKQFQTGNSDLMDKKADMGGRDIYAPSVDMMKMYATKDTKLFDATSAFSGQVSPLSGQKSDLMGDAKLGQFDHIFDDKVYRGREADLIREAMDRLDQQAQTQLHQQMAGQRPQGSPGSQGPGAASQPGQSMKVKPLITIEDVSALVNKDLGVAAEPAQGATTAPTSPVSDVAPAPSTSTAKP